MKKYLFSLLGAALLAVQPLAAQLPAGLSADRIVFNIKPGAKGVKLIVRMKSEASGTRLWHGEGEGFTEVTNSALVDDRGVEVNYAFTNVSDASRQIAVETDNVVTVSAFPYENKQHVIEGVAELASASVTSLRLVNNKMEAGSKIDVSKAVALEELLASFTGAEEVVLPKGTTLKHVEVSPVLLEKSYLKKINLADARGLETLRISEHALDTIDLTKNVRLKALNVTNSKHPNKLRAILGVKQLTNLEEFNGEGNRLGFDQLPDMLGSKEVFRYGNQSTIKVADERIKGLTIDLSHLYEHKGINGHASKEYHKTTFEWYTVVLGKNSKGQTIVTSSAKIDPNLYKEEGGVFTFDESLLQEGERSVRVKISNIAAYPGIGAIADKVLRTFKDDILTYVMKLTKPANTSAIESITSDAIKVYASGGKVLFDVDKLTEPALIYNVAGQLVTKTTESVVLPKGIYIVYLSGKATKVLVN